jgi:mRNA-degrading endonuclease RelE of RelBE toxin-antitoxin system
LKYTVVFLRTFLKQFRFLPADVKLRVGHRVEELSENPYLGLKIEEEVAVYLADKKKMIIEAAK